MDFSVGAGYLTPSSPAYDSRRDSTMSEQSSSSYGHSFGSVHSGTSSYCSPHLPQTPTQMRNLKLNESVIVETPQHNHDTKEYTDYYSDRQCTRTVPNLQVASHNWSPHAQSRRNVPLPPLRSSAYDQRILTSDTTDYNSGFGIVGPQKSQPQPLMPTPEMCSSSDGWLTPPPATYPMAQGIQYYPHYPEGVVESRSITPYTWPTTLPTVEQFVTNTFDNSMVPSTSSFSSDGSVYARMPSEGYEADREGYFCRPMYSASPISPNMPSSTDRQHQFLGHGQVELPSGTRIGHRPVRTPVGVRGIRKERNDVSSSRRKAKSFKTDVGYIHAPDGSHIPVQIQGDFKKDSTGRWTTGSIDSQKHRCNMHKGGEKCSRTFKRIEHLRRHMRTHTLEQPFACEFPTEKLEDGVVQLERCSKQFQRNDNCVAHFKTHVSQDKNGLYFPAFRPTKEKIESASNDSLVELAQGMRSRIHSDDRKKGSRNPRVTWEEFLVRIKEIKTPEDSAKIIASVFKSCLKDDEKTRTGGR